MTQSNSVGRGSGGSQSSTPASSQAPNGPALTEARGTPIPQVPPRDTKRRNGRHRTFSAGFKAEIALALISGQKSHAELCREHELSQYLVQTWKEHFLCHASAAFESAEQHNEQETARVAELERLLGHITLENSILKKASQKLSTRKRGENW